MKTGIFKKILPHILDFHPCIGYYFPFVLGSTHFFAWLSCLVFICLKIEVCMEISHYLQRQKKLLISTWGRNIKDPVSSSYRVEMFGFKSDVSGFIHKDENHS
jgi:hypothetical protein